MAISTSTEFTQLVQSLGIDYTPTEFHGFLCGLVAGGVQDESWQTLTYQFTHDGHAFSQSVLLPLVDFYRQLNEAFEEANPCFSLWLNEEDAFAMADGIADWTSHFLLGLGLAQPKLNQENDEVNEAVADLADIARLGYDEEEESADELLEAAEEIVEYLRIIALFLHSHFAKPMTGSKPNVLH